VSRRDDGKGSGEDTRLLRRGTSAVFATANDCRLVRRAKTTDLALEALLDYQDRYARCSRCPSNPGSSRSSDRPGNATTDFGAPGVDTPWDTEALSAPELRRQVAVLVDCWSYFDDVVTNAPATLTRGPRGGGRDRDEIVPHVREAERHYCSKLGTGCLRERRGPNSAP